LLSFAALPFYRSPIRQKRIIVTNLVVNTLLFAFVIYKYVHWLNDDRIKLEQPVIQAGAVFPVLIEMLLLAALQKIKSNNE
jgi:hypothetical protein